MEVESTPTTRPLNGVGSLLPARAWRSPAMLAVRSRVAGVALGAGRVRLVGLVPNGQRFVTNPLATPRTRPARRGARPEDKRRAWGVPAY
jgi:hypothetical protein